MVTCLLSSPRRHLTRILSALLAFVVWLLPLAPARAASAPPDANPAWEQVHKELDTLQNQQGLYTVQQARRLADLSRLETAITDSSDSPTVDNTTTHNLGVFVRGKRQPADQPATFAVLAAGHQTDDDQGQTVALYVPANVAVSWAGRQGESGTTPARVVRLLPGVELQVSEVAGSGGYGLNLPAFAIEIESADLAALPSFSQEELDAQPETAPVD